MKLTGTAIPKSSRCECFNCKKSIHKSNSVAKTDTNTQEVMVFCGKCNRMLAYEKLPAMEQEYIFQDKLPKRYWQARMEHIPKALRQTIESLPEEQGGYFWGKSGVGKTYAMVAAMRKYITEGYTVQRIDYDMLLLKLRDTFKPSSAETELDVILPFLATDKLFIEDVGTTVRGSNEESAFSLRTFLLLLDQRIQQCQPTFLTGNKSVSQLANSFDERIASRISTFKVAECTGRDRRIDIKELQK